MNGEQDSCYHEDYAALLLERIFVKISSRLPARATMAFSVWDDVDEERVLNILKGEKSKETSSRSLH